METDLTDHLINDKYQKAEAQRLVERQTENSWGHGNTEDFIGVLYLVCEPPAKHTPGKVGYGKSGSPMTNIFIVPTLYNTHPITYTHPYECNSSISVPSLKPQFEQLKFFYTSFSRQKTRLEVPASSLFSLKDSSVGPNLLLQSSQYFMTSRPT